MKIGMLAGESSGDLLGAGLITQLRKDCPNLTVTGIGGPAMQAAGCHSLYEMDRLAVMGLIEPLFRLPELFRIRRELINYFTQNLPQVFVGIDSPEFNLGLELKIRKAGAPVIHYVSPSVWAWRQNRIYKIAQATDLVLTLFPFESDFYDKYNVPVRFVGHPLADVIPLETDKLAARAALGLDLEATYIALLPGSRRHELKHMAALFVETAQACALKRPQLKFITSAVNAARDQEFQKVCQQLAPKLAIEFFTDKSHQVMAAADVVLVASGTATLETLLFKKPMVIASRLGAITFQIARRLVKLKFIGLPNLLANDALVPEFIQSAAQPVPMAEALLEYLDCPDKVQELEVKFSKIHRQLRRNANQQAAEAVMQFV